MLLYVYIYVYIYIYTLFMITLAGAAKGAGAPKSAEARPPDLSPLGSMSSEKAQTLYPHLVCPFQILVLFMVLPGLLKIRLFGSSMVSTTLALTAAAFAAALSQLLSPMSSKTGE